MKKIYFIGSLALGITFANAQEATSLLKDPSTQNVSHSTISIPVNGSNNLLGGGSESTIYAIDLRATPNIFGTLPWVEPYTIDVISEITDDYIAGDLDGDGTFYGVNSTNGNFDKIDKTSGSITTIGPLTNMKSGHSITGLSWNYANSTMYSLSSDGSITTLYTVDLETGEMTELGDIGTQLGIWLAISTDGEAYVAELNTDSLYKVNLEDLATDEIGVFGYNLNYAQDADFDPATNKLYMAAYIGAGENYFCSVDLETGEATPLGTINNMGSEVCALAIEGELPAGVNDVNQTQISYYPNPVVDELTIAAKQTIEKVSVYSLDGKLVKTIQMNGKTNKIDLGSLPSGVYELTAKMGKEVKSFKIIKK